MAVGEMIDDDPTACRIFGLAEGIEAQIADCADPQAPTDQLRIIFQTDLKRFLPRYYDDAGNKRSATELKHFHMHQRWDVSGQRIAEFARTKF